MFTTPFSILLFFIIVSLNCFEYKSDLKKKRFYSTSKNYPGNYVNIGKLSEKAGYSIECTLILLKI